MEQAFAIKSRVRDATGLVGYSAMRSSVQTIENRLRNMTDRLGMPIDQEIFSVVVALNAVGFVTRQSCQGHLDHGRPVPWVMIQNEQAAICTKNAVSAKDNGDIEGIFHWCKVREEVIDAQRATIRGYLKRFYEQRQVEYDCEIIVEQENNDISLIRTRGTDLKKEHTEKRLCTYQQEMQAFGLFLMECNEIE